MDHLPHSYGSPYTQSVDSIIMSEVIKTFSTTDFCPANISNLFTSIFSKLPKIILFIIAKKCIESSGSLFEPFISSIKSTFLSLFYRQKEYSTVDALKKEFYITRVIKQQVPLTTFPIASMMVKEGEGTVIVSYVPGLHTRYLSEYELKGEEALLAYEKTKKNKQSNFYIAKPDGTNLNYKKCTHSFLFPSRNYKKLSLVIKNHFEVSMKVLTNDIVGILIDGVPGLGKTKFADYASSIGLTTNIYKIDMTRFNSINVKSAIKSAFHSVPIDTPTIFVIDELDKYLDARLRIEYEAERKTEKKDDSLSRSYEEFVNYTKPGYLYEILYVLERDDMKAPAVVIFCSNNFGTIFSGIKLDHYISLYNRFLKFTFEKCDHEELIEYMDYYNQLLETKVHPITGIEITKEYMSEALRKDVSITYRDLRHYSIEVSYNTMRLIELLNKRKDKPDLLENDRKQITIAKNENSLEIESNSRTISRESKSPNTSAPNSPRETLEPSQNSSHSERNFVSDEESYDESSQPYTPKISPSVPEDICIYHIKYLSKNAEEYQAYLEELPEHLKIWVEEYVKPNCSRTIDSIEKSEATRKIGLFLNKNATAQSSGEQLAHILELFQFLASDSDAIMILLTSSGFPETVRLKIEEFSQCKTQPLAPLDAKTKRFVYALSGIKV